MSLRKRCIDRQIERRCQQETSDERSRRNRNAGQLLQSLREKGEYIEQDLSDAEKRRQEKTREFLRTGPSALRSGIAEKSQDRRKDQYAPPVAAVDIPAKKASGSVAAVQMNQ